jgi:hypothetical protein
MACDGLGMQMADDAGHDDAAELAVGRCSQRHGLSLDRSQARPPHHPDQIWEGWSPPPCTDLLAGSVRRPPPSAQSRGLERRPRHGLRFCDGRPPLLGLALALGTASTWERRRCH